RGGQRKPDWVEHSGEPSRAWWAQATGAFGLACSLPQAWPRYRSPRLRVSQMEHQPINDTKSGAKAVKTLSTGLLLTVAYLGFISLGLPDPLAGVAWPSVRDAFDLQQSSFGLVFIALGCGYCASGFFGGKLTHALGLGNLLWISSALVAVAMFGS